MEKQITKYNVFFEGSHEYDLVVTKGPKKKTFELFYSNNDVWNEKYRNKSIIKLINNGNGFKFNKKINKKVGYSKADYIRLLLNFETYIHDNQENKVKYSIVNSDNKIEI